MKHCLVLLLIISLIFSGGVFAQQTPPVIPKDFSTGLKIALQAVKEYGLVDDPEKVKRINDIGYRVARRAAPSMPYFSFRIIKMEEPNAFALPGGFVFVTSGMLDLDLTDDELAALLGHEIIHIKNNHIGRMSKRATLMTLLYQALIIGIAFGIKEGDQRYDPVTGLPRQSGKSEILQGSAAFGLVFQELLLRGFNRELELESDEQGMSAAAGAGFSPEGTSRLFDKMRRKIFEAPGYGYWRTHPYLEDRMGVARVLSASVEISKNPEDPERYRSATQQSFVDQIQKQKEEESRRELRRMALNAHPKGETADGMRLWFIRQAEADEMKKEPFYRDYGKLVKVYQTNIDEIEANAGTSEFPKKLRISLDKIKAERDTTHPLYEEVLKKQMFDTDMLERYISNFPNSARIPEVQFRLAENYRVLKRSSDAAELYLKTLASNSEWKPKGKESLKHMVSSVDDLSACYKVATQAKDPEIERAARERMKKLSGSFANLQNGYEFRRNYPSTNYEKEITSRMTQLASQRLNQGRLYQAIGEYQKALDQYNQILRYCSDLPIADQVKDTITDFQEVTSAST